jgi:hypothetical protein
VRTLFARLLVRLGRLDPVCPNRGGVTVAFVASPRNVVPWAVLGLALLGCGTVDPGPQFQVAEVVFDQNFFFCKVEPMLIAQRCSAGDPTKDTQGSCHGSVTGFRLQDPDPPLTSQERCGSGIVPAPGVSISSTSQANWGAASIKMRTDPEQAPLLRRPTNQAPHPREIFSAKSPEANLIRQWATQYSSR